MNVWVVLDILFKALFCNIPWQPHTCTKQFYLTSILMLSPQVGSTTTECGCGSARSNQHQNIQLKTSGIYKQKYYLDR